MIEKLELKPKEREPIHAIKWSGKQSDFDEFKEMLYELGNIAYVEYQIVNHGDYSTRGTVKIDYGNIDYGGEATCHTDIISPGEYVLTGGQMYMQVISLCGIVNKYIIQGENAISE